MNSLLFLPKPPLIKEGQVTLVHNLMPKPDEPQKRVSPQEREQINLVLKAMRDKR